jgi:hypothetical protein
LCFDHINSDGAVDRKRISKTGSGGTVRHYLQNLGEAKEKIQILCANCNLIKAKELKEWGHK